MFKNAEQDDLWHYLTEAAHMAGTLPANLTVKTIMDTWTLQMGFPVVTVTRISNTTATVTQEYFKLDDTTLCPTTPPSSTPSTSPAPPIKSWYVPLTYTSGDQPDFNDTRVKLWMAAGEDPPTYEVTLPNSSHWVIFNVLQSAYYRVNYDEANWKLLARQLKENHHVIHAINRAQIIDDAFNLARAGRLSYEMVLDLISYLSQEKEYVPWSATFSNLQYIYSMFHRDPAYGALKDYILSLIQPLYDHIGTEELSSDSLQNQQLRSDMLTWACRLGNVHCRNMSLSLYRQWMADPAGFKGISPNIMEAVGCTALEVGGEAEWSFAWKQPQMKDALGCTRELWILMRYLDGGFNASSGIRRQDAAITFRRVAMRATGAVLAWDYMRANWERIVEYIGTTFFALPRMVEDVTRSFNTRQQLQELQEFQKQHNSRLLTATTAVQQAVEATTINVVWMNNNRRFIVDWLARHGYTSELNTL
ncbi:Aminopeptidase N [Portunus trituberculatus]|uniref:Aminopeptidase N n=2 Tax=Portunus trituberculatus TaxID=210409 RepID=A0A5B7FHS0_PORTR|nr:Aminopeptidase N [Portunus trituberculatus]